MAAEGELIEAVEHIGRRAGVRTVVEGQRHPVSAGSRATGRGRRAGHGGATTAPG